MASAGEESPMNASDKTDTIDSDRLIPASLLSAFLRPDYLERSAWLEHIPFAFWLIGAHQPETLVELGTHYGSSYFAFCQGVARLGLRTRCYAVDTWKGDEHAGLYGEEVFRSVNAYNSSRYSGFSRLVRSTFDEALNHFSDGSIDLLHIDGLHTRGAVSHDLESWLPKLSDRGIVLFHDSNVRERGFGVFKVIEELRKSYPCFEFTHGHGLAVVGIGQKRTDLITRLFQAEKSPSSQRAIQEIFSRLGGACTDTYAISENEVRVRDLQDSVDSMGKETAQIRQSLVTSRAELMRSDKKHDDAARELAIAQEKIEQCMVERDEARLSLASTKDQLQSCTKERDDALDALAFTKDKLEFRTTERDEALRALMSAKTKADPRESPQSLLKWSRSWRIPAPPSFANNSLHNALSSIVFHSEKADGRRPRKWARVVLVKKDGRARRIFGRPLIPLKAPPVRSRLISAETFDASWYLEAYPDVRAAGVDPWQHYVKYGRAEGRQTTSWESVDQRGIKKPAFGDSSIRSQGRTLRETLSSIVFHSKKSNGRRPRKWARLVLIRKDGRPRRIFRRPLISLEAPLVGNHSVSSESFDASWYLEAYPDVRTAGVDPWLHYVTYGRSEGRRPTSSELGTECQHTRFGVPEYGATGPAIKFDAEPELPPDFGLTIAVHLHLYYPDLIQEFCRYLRNIPVNFALFVSVPEGRGDLEYIRTMLDERVPHATTIIVRPVVNRGRDIAPFVVEFGKDLLIYDLILHLHSKKSPHNPEITTWRRFLLHYVLGDASVVSQILSAFHSDRRLGAFFPPYHPAVRGQPLWAANRQRVEDLLSRWGHRLEEDLCPDFPAGSFFWARSDALRPLLDGHLKLADFEQEPLQNDGATPHAIERLLGLVPRLRNFTTTMRYIDIAHNLTHYFGPGRAFPEFDRDRTLDIIAYQDAVRNRPPNRLRVALVTAVIGPFDSLLLPESLEQDVDYFCFSDSIDDGYGVFRILPPPYVDADPRRTARYIKTNLPKLFPDYDFVVWADANVLIRSSALAFVAASNAADCGVGAIPHPVRETYFEEAQEVKALALDDESVIDAQIDRYRSLPELAEEQLIETNFMVLDVRRPEVHQFCRLWWNEINSYSKRDQLSINYALLKAGVQWHPLLEERKSTRDAEEFALFRHGLNQWWRTSSIYASWYISDSLDGHLLPLPNIGKPVRSKTGLDLDVVVCVHNALDDVRACLASVVEALSGRGRIVIVDDASEEETQQFLEQFAEGSGAQLVRHSKSQGYTRAANRGLRASTSTHILLLNSDTIVPRRALDKLVQALEDDPNLGIVGPLSNAASWQSVPSNVGNSTQTAINGMPPGMTIEEIDQFYERRWNGEIVRTPLVHGFCFCIKRDVIDKVGYFDEKSFPRGYGEENDFCFRAADAGFDLGVLSSTYVYHSKSKSYKDEERTKLMSEGGKALALKVTKSRIDHSVNSMRMSPAFEKSRNALIPLFHRELAGPRKRGRLFLLPSLRDDNRPAGSGYVRVLLPYKTEAITKEWDVVELHRPALPELRANDAVVVQRDFNSLESDALQDWIARVRLTGARLIYDLDDDLLDSVALQKRGYRGDVKDLAARVRFLAAAADIMTVSSSALVERLGEFNPNIAMIPNALDSDLWKLRSDDVSPLKIEKTTKRQRITIGYVGTPTHGDDLAIIRNSALHLQNLHGAKIDFQIVGGFQTQSDHFGTHVALPKKNDYPSFVRWLKSNFHWDIALVPLVDEEFNIAKSYLKFLECAALGAAIICSNTKEYSSVVSHGQNGLLVDNTSDSWKDAINQLVSSQVDRIRLAKNAFYDVKTQHTLDRIADARLKVLRGELTSDLSVI